MDSYPSEFTSHHLPLMFVAGLGTATTPFPVPGAAAAASPPLPSDPAPQPTPPTDPFAALFAALKKVIVGRKSWSVWDNTRGVNHDFHVVLVEKTIRFPPLKARPPPPTEPQPTSLHSPISPLSPSSPLYPDGILAPIWIRKHREMIPSVFVLVLRLSGPSFSSDAPLPVDPQAKEDEERVRDAELVREIMDRKRTTIERGIKLAVVLVCSRSLLDDPTLDNRLSLIRRQSGLDSRASLFVVSPVPQAEVLNFVLSLRAELWPSALDYYREHGRRVRRKRARQVPKGRLSEKGWIVRYDYKMGLFSEMRGEVEVALKHYEDSYDTLVEMFVTPALLTPRTKRWAEAKVLADCLTVKIAKMYLYMNEPSRSVAQLNRHVTKFRELSNEWGIGEQTFEFWSWLSKQYRMFADLVSIAVRAGFRLPILRPPPTPRSVPAGMQQPQSPGLVPLNVLQHPGYYFYLSGCCAVERRDRYKVALEKEKEKEGTPLAEGETRPPPPPSIAHETKVEHAEIIIDLFTKAYEFFKAHKTSRMTLFLASQIALTHFENGNHEMALKFHERIARTYRREKWRDILDAILERSYVSASALGDHESAIRTLFGLLAPDSRIPLAERAKYGKELMGVLENKTPKSPEQATIVVDMADVAPLFDARVAFWKPSSDIGQPVAFQFSIASSSNSKSAAFVFSQLQLQFNDDRKPVTILHEETMAQGAKVERYDLGDLKDSSFTIEEKKASLVWDNGGSKVFGGVIVGSREVDLTITTATLRLIVGEWTLDLVFRPDTTPTTDTTFDWLLPGDAGSIPLLTPTPWLCTIRPRELRMVVSVVNQVPAFLDEEFAIHVDVANEDVVEVEVFLDILVQPGEDNTKNQVTVDDQVSTSYIKAVSMGVLAPSASTRKTFRLLCSGAAGDRYLDLSIRSQPTLLGETSIPSTSSASAIPSVTETLKSLTIPAIPPLFHAFDTHFHRRKRPVKPLLDLSPPTGWEGASDVTIVAKLCATGPWELDVFDIQLVCEHSPAIRVAQSSLEGATVPMDLVLRKRDFFNAVFRLDLMALPPGANPAFEATGAYLEILWRRHGDDFEHSNRTLFPLPPLRLAVPTPSVRLRLPPFLTLHAPTILTYRFANPTHQVITLSTQVDSSEGFVFAGPRKFTNLVLAPEEERDVQIQVIPLAVGPSVLPRLRVFELEKPTGLNTQEGVVAPSPVDPAAPLPVPKTKEIQVTSEAEVEEIKDPAQVGLETDLRAARGVEDGGDANGESPNRPFVVMVLPR